MRKGIFPPIPESELVPLTPQQKANLLLLAMWTFKGFLTAVILPAKLSRSFLEETAVFFRAVFKRDFDK